MEAAMQNGHTSRSAVWSGMTTWRFFQGLRKEWRRYRFDSVAQVIASSDKAFAELRACMKNAEYARFRRWNYQVHVRGPGSHSREPALLRSHWSQRGLSSRGFSGLLVTLSSDPFDGFRAGRAGEP
ncbi:MAG: hypothetical protein ACXWI0_05880 [Burkholderiales bacterium]